MADFDLVRSIVLTRLEKKVGDKLKTTYPNLSFDTVKNTNPAKFPNVFLQEVEASEVGNTLDGTTYNGQISSMQLTITTNTLESDCRKVAWACVDVLKSMRYKIVGSPYYDKINDVHTIVIRARRTLCAGDKF